MSFLRRLIQGSADRTAPTRTLETTFIERVRQRRAHWLPEVRQALEMLEIAEENEGFEHVRVLPTAPHEA
jgi:hypothetical protein